MADQTALETVKNSGRATWAAALTWCTAGCLSLSFALEALLETDLSALMLFASTTQQAIATWLGSKGPDIDVPLVATILLSVAITGLALGTIAAARTFQRLPVSHGLKVWMVRGGRWLCVAGIWAFVGVLCLASGSITVATVVSGNLHWAICLSLAGWIGELSDVLQRPTAPDSHRSTDGWSVAFGVWIAMAVYVVVFVTMNWQLERSLLIPHGDSSMYEEHLWNLTHGKGFRSYLDQGLFLGEHVQIVHVLLLPLYVLWPTHGLLEVCQSVALASGAVPVFWMARRATNHSRAAVWVAVAYLLYPPMQFLDIAIDLKTFRPEAFVVPAMLFGFDQLERGRLKSMLVCFAIGLSAKEDYALILGPLGLWIALRPLLERNLCVTELPPLLRNRRQSLMWGFGLLGFSVAYLLVATQVVMRFFRDGEELHYVRYFPKFGTSFGEVVLNMLTQPGLVASELLTPQSAFYVLGLLAPLGLLALLAPTRMAVSMPLMGLLCLNTIVHSDPFPRHHLQAPVVPLLMWAAIGGLQRVESVLASPRWLRMLIALRDVWLFRGATSASSFRIGYLLGAALVGTAFAAQGPLSIRFWDPASVAYWKSNYVPNRRAELFERVMREIPTTASVASTDFVHPRFTHHERSYDYSNYRRRVSNYADRVPDDTDFIVIDTQHRYSEIKSPEQIRELRSEAHRWEVLDLPTEGFFIVLKRRPIVSPDERK